MTLQDIQKRNEHFQKKTIELVELLPGSGFLEVSTALIRSIRLIDKYLIKSLQVQTPGQFSRLMGMIEEELDEAVYILDRIDKTNRTYKMKAVENFLKEGYDLLAIYSLCCDQLIGKKLRVDEDIL
jgi:hypothetical protein